VNVLVGDRRLPGILSVPAAPKGLVIFAHGSGSSRLSPRNAHAAETLGERGFATLLFDLLTPAESQDRRNVFDIPLLAHRVVDAIAWARGDKRLERLPIGLFGASTGAGAAIAAAAAREDVSAVVSRGGRPDLAGEALSRIAAPTLLVVGGEDREVIALNRAAQRRMRCRTELHIVPGAGHLFEEPGTLDQALDAAGAWFEAHLEQGPT
jgi:alpha-beta hydrolase superfamily lysophospholipase